MGVIKDFLALLRVKQWFKNIFVFAALLFSEKLYDQPALIASALAFFSFCMVSSAIYIVNDIHDAASDRRHPRKKHRPIASGKIDRGPALLTALILFGGGCALGFTIRLLFLATLVLYSSLSMFYTFAGKRMIIVDIFCIAMGFIFRVAGGALAISVETSGWMMMTTFFLALFLGVGKRRNEILIRKAHRSLKDTQPVSYDVSYVNHILIACGTVALISYALYTRDPSVIQRIGTNGLTYTVPLVAYGLFRHTYLLWHTRNGDPTEVILHDCGLLVDIALWVLAIVFLVYLKNGYEVAKVL